MGLFLGLKNMTDSTQCQVYSKRSINKINNYRYFYFAAVAILFALDRVDMQRVTNYTYKKETIQAENLKVEQPTY